MSQAFYLFERRKVARVNMCLRFRWYRAQMNAMFTPLASAPGPLVPQTRNTLLHLVGRGVMAAAGWRLAGEFPNRAKFVVVVAPHTSNWDFPILLMAKWALRLDPRWMGKDAIFVGPLGWFLRRVGGIPVERSATHNVVDGLVRAFAERQQMVLVLAPEGTRRHVTEWKSGFWHIARGADVPIVCVALDYGRKTIRLGPAFSALEDDPIAGIARIRASYAGVLGRHPGLHD